MASESRQHITTYAFIDGQNLHLGVKKPVERNGRRYPGWKLDFAKFHRYLRDRFKVKVAFLFIGDTPDEDHRRLRAELASYGYTIILKPVGEFRDEHGRPQYKGNVDTDIVLYAAAKEINNYDEAIIVSGDGDFLCLYDYLDAHGKLGSIVIPNRHSYSQMLDNHKRKHVYVSDKK